MPTPDADLSGSAKAIRRLNNFFRIVDAARRVIMTHICIDPKNMPVMGGSCGIHLTLRPT